jgi:hypothetical protein
VSGRVLSRTSRDGATLADPTQHSVTCVRFRNFLLSGSEPILAVPQSGTVVACSAGGLCQLRSRRRAWGSAYSVQSPQFVNFKCYIFLARD